MTNLNQIKKEIDSDLKDLMIMEMVSKAISYKKKLYIEYANKNKNNEYTGRMVIPIELKLKAKNGPGFLTVDEFRGSEHDSKQYRHFKFGNIAKAVILDDMILTER